MDENDLRWILNKIWELAEESVPDGCYYGCKRPKTLRFILRDKIFYYTRTAVKEWFREFRPNIDPYKKSALNAHIMRVISRIVTWGWKDWYVQNALELINEIENL